MYYLYCNILVPNPNMLQSYGLKYIKSTMYTYPSYNLYTPSNRNKDRFFALDILVVVATD